MQTFLPLPSFQDSAKILDNKRLGKQRVECKQILRALLREVEGWKNHPATKMWTGCERALCEYAIAICVEWRSRGFEDSLLSYFQDKLLELPETGNPQWLGSTEFHSSHRSNLLRKDANHYGQFGWTEDSTLPYFWPKVDTNEDA